MGVVLVIFSHLKFQNHIGINMYVYVVMREVAYEGSNLEGIFFSRDSAYNLAKALCQERLNEYEKSNEPYYDSRNEGKHEMFHDGDVEFWFYKQEVKD